MSIIKSQQGYIDAIKLATSQDNRPCMGIGCNICLKTVTFTIQGITRQARYYTARMGNFNSRVRSKK